MRRAVIYGLMGILAMGLTTAVLAQSLPRLPKEYAFPQSPDSPGVVTFNHETHLAMQEKPDCTVCHSKLFKILEPGQTADGSPIRHAVMEKKGQCGACHNGEAATGLDQCDHCHKATED
jgi:c(7)-type cytochrome triheme protein